MLYILFAKLIDMSIMATVVIAVVLVVRALLGKAPKKYAYILWVVVGIRLICPGGISSPLSIYNLVNVSDYSIYDRQQTETGTQSAEENKASIKKQIDGNDTELNSKNHSESMKSENVNKSTIYNKSANAEGLQSGVNNGADRKPMETRENKVIQAGAFIWLAGCIIIVFWNVVLLYRISRRVAQAVRLKENIYECDYIPSPFVLGIIAPKIYIPFRLKESEQEYIINHEKYHIKRKDNIVKLIAFLLCVLHWCNPFVWLAYSLMIRDMEMSCDEYVLGQSAEDIRKSYSESLLGFATNTRTIGIGMLPFGETNTRRRVKRVMKFKKAGKWVGAVAVVMVLVVGVCCLTDAGTNKKAGKAEQITGMKSGESTDKVVKADESTDMVMKAATASEKNFIVLSTAHTGDYEIGLAYYSESEIDKNPENGYYVSSYGGKESGEKGETKFSIVCSKDGKIVNKMDLTTGMFDVDEISFPADGIKLTLVDYDGDGEKNDFALGQGQTMVVEAGNFMSYGFFGVDSDGEVIQYYTSTEDRRTIVTIPGEYSPEFVRKDGQVEYTGLTEEGTETMTTSICRKKGNQRQIYSEKIGDVSFQISASNMNNCSSDDQYIKYKYAKYDYTFLEKETMCLYVGERKEDVESALSKDIHYTQVEQVGEWSYFVKKGEKIIRVNCYEDADGVKYFGCYWEEKGKKFLNIQKRDVSDYGMVAKVSADIAESTEKID